MLTTLGPGIFDWEAAGGGQSSRETSVRLHGATSARPSLKPSRSNPCELLQPLLLHLALGCLRVVGPRSSGPYTTPSPKPTPPG